MSEIKRKKITVASNGAINLYGGTFGPINTPFSETIPNIGKLLGDGVEVYEHIGVEKIRLDMSNFDQSIEEERKIISEDAARQEQAKQVQVNDREKQKYPQNNKKNYQEPKIVPVPVVDALIEE